MFCVVCEMHARKENDVKVEGEEKIEEKEVKEVKEVKVEVEEKREEKKQQIHTRRNLHRQLKNLCRATKCLLLTVIHLVEGLSFFVMFE